MEYYLIENLGKLYQQHTCKIKNIVLFSIFNDFSCKCDYIFLNYIFIKLCLIYINIIIYQKFKIIGMDVIMLVYM